MNIARQSVAYRCLGAAAVVALSASCNHDAAAATPEKAAPLVYAHPKPSILLVHEAFADALGSSRKARDYVFTHYSP